MTIILSNCPKFSIYFKPFIVKILFRDSDYIIVKNKKMKEEARIYLSDIIYKIDNNSEQQLDKEIIIIEADHDISSNSTVDTENGITYI
jgi:hypothetical protein